jgi:hypothetical protein
VLLEHTVMRQLREFAALPADDLVRVRGVLGDLRGISSAGSTKSTCPVATALSGMPR